MLYFRQNLINCYFANHKKSTMKLFNINKKIEKESNIEIHCPKKLIKKRECNICRIKNKGKKNSPQTSYCNIPLCKRYFPKHIL